MTLREAELEVEGRVVPLTNTERVLWRETGFTKGDLIEYYLGVGDAMVPHLAGRPLMLGRWPLGVDERGWGQLECRGRPSWMASAPLRLRTGETLDACVVNDVASLVWLANQGVIELHPYLARAESFDRPTAVIFDLDPGQPAGLVECCRLALLLRDLLRDLGLRAYAKHSGGTGLHLFVPLNTTATFAATKAFARAIASRLARIHPELVVDEMSRSLRSGKVFVDWAQNDARKQTVAPYSLRATSPPAVSAPLLWDEIQTSAARHETSPLRLAPSQVIARIRAGIEPFRDVAVLRQTLPAL